jgi:glycine hydroxymethyltransferase
LIQLLLKLSLGAGYDQSREFYADDRTTLMTQLQRRGWVPEASEDLVQRIAGETAQSDADAIEAALLAAVEQNRTIHDRDCINLNPATNAMNPKAERLLAAGLGARPSLGYPGDKYEMGLEGIERIEVICAELAAEIFGAKYAEIRVGSGALANLYAFMATAKPGETILVPPGEIGGHVTHHDGGAAGLYGLRPVAMAVDAAGYTVDIDKLAVQARALRPKLITIGGSFNLFPHPIADIRRIADGVGAKVLFDAAHMSGMIAGRAWQQPLEEGAHLMTMSTYKSLGGPPAGLVLTNDAALAERLDAIAYPGLTANSDAGKAASLAMTLLDWKVHGRAYGAAMAETAKALAVALDARGLPVHAMARGGTVSHQLALDAHKWNGGQAASKKMRPANLLACGIGLPTAPIDGDVNGLRFGVNEIVRLGMGPEHMPELAGLIARSLVGNDAPEQISGDVSKFRGRFKTMRFVR